MDEMTVSNDMLSEVLNKMTSYVSAFDIKYNSVLHMNKTVCLSDVESFSSFFEIAKLPVTNMMKCEYPKDISCENPEDAKFAVMAIIKYEDGTYVQPLVISLTQLISLNGKFILYCKR